MKNKDIINIQEKAETLGINGKIEIDNEVINNLIPSSFLKSMGLTLEQRIENLLLLVKANLYPNEICSQTNRTFYIPFTLVRGPYIKEDLFPVFVELSENDKAKIIIRKAQDDSEE